MTKPVPSPSRGQVVRALSIRQPWAWLILHAGKDIENRSWRTSFRGRVLIHASKGMTRMEYEGAAMFLTTDIPRDITLPAFDELERGGIVGSVDITGCWVKHQSPWFVGLYGFSLANPQPLPFAPCRGGLGFFRPQLHWLNGIDSIYEVVKSSDQPRVDTGNPARDAMANNRGIHTNS